MVEARRRFGRGSYQRQSTHLEAPYSSPAALRWALFRTPSIRLAAPLRSLAAEITREKIFERLHDELPYQITVETDQWKDQKDGSVRIEQTIFVTRDSHKKIVIGEGGQMLKSIGSAARKDICEAAETKVHLFLFVKVRENWIDDPDRYREMGLEFPKE